MSEPPRGASGPVLAPGARVAEDVRFGCFVVVHERVRIGAGCEIGDHAVIGKPPRLSAHSTATGPVEELELGEHVGVGAGAIVFAGARVADGAIIGDQAFVRERSTIGAESVVGRGSVVEQDVSIGARVRLQTGVYITAHCIIEDDVFVGPGVVTSNDNTMARHPRGEQAAGAHLARACRVGAAAVLLPGVRVGEEAFVAAGALVSRDIPARTLVMGAPARVVREISDHELLERWR